MREGIYSFTYFVTYLGCHPFSLQEFKIKKKPK